MSQVSKQEFVLNRGVGSRIWDADGNEYLDATAGLWFANVGHGRQVIAEAMADQAARLAAYSSFGDVVVDTAARLADEVAALAPMPNARVFFTSGGSDSVDTAIKIVRRWTQLTAPDQSAHGVSGRTTIAVLNHAYHGMHQGGTSLSGIPLNRAGNPGLDPDVVQLAHGDLDAALATIDATPGLAAVFAEPVTGAGARETLQETCRGDDPVVGSEDPIAPCPWVAYPFPDVVPAVAIDRRLHRQVSSPTCSLESMCWLCAAGVESAPSRSARLIAAWSAASRPLCHPARRHHRRRARAQPLVPLDGRRGARAWRACDGAP